MPHPQQGYRIGKTRVPGVTTIIGRFKESGALLHWAFKQGMAAERGEIKSLYDKRDEAAEAGTLAHEMVEAHIRGAKLTYTASKDIVKQARAAFEAYLSWESMTKLKIVEQEMQLVSRRYRFGGTPDAIGKINGELCLIDWKSSSGIYRDYLLQLAAYKYLWEENNPDRPLTGGFHICRFSKFHGDFEHRYFKELDRALNMFILLREAYEIDKELKQRVR